MEALLSQRVPVLQEQVRSQKNTRETQEKKAINNMKQKYKEFY